MSLIAGFGGYASYPINRSGKEGVAGENKENPEQNGEYSNPELNTDDRLFQTKSVSQAANPFTLNLIKNTLENMERICQKIRESFGLIEDSELAEEELAEKEADEKRRLDKIINAIELLKNIMTQVLFSDPIQAGQKLAQAEAILTQIGNLIADLPVQISKDMEAAFARALDEYGNLREDMRGQSA